MEIQDIHAGNQIHVSSASLGEGLGCVAPGLRDPTALGIGAAAIPGSIYANGVVLIGSPLAYPVPGEATLMVARQNPKINPKASHQLICSNITRDSKSIPAQNIDNIVAAG